MQKVINFNIEDGSKLILLAEWLDKEQEENYRWDGKSGSYDVQKDLRRIASIINQRITTEQ